MKIQVIRQSPKVSDVAYYSKILHSNMQTMLRAGTRAYIEAILPLIQVDTGMSKASLIPLGRAIRKVGAIRSSIVPERKMRYGVTNMDGSYDSKGIKNAAAGERAGQDAFKFDYGSQTNPAMSFEFRINVYQYWLQENYSKGGTSPWKTFDKGRKALIEYIRANSTKFVPSFITERS